MATLRLGTTSLVEGCQGQHCFAILQHSLSTSSISARNSPLKMQVSYNWLVFPCPHLQAQAESSHVSISIENNFKWGNRSNCGARRAWKWMVKQRYTDCREAVGMARWETGTGEALEAHWPASLTDTAVNNKRPCTKQGGRWVSTHKAGFSYLHLQTVVYTQPHSHTEACTQPKTFLIITNTQRKSPTVD